MNFKKSYVGRRSDLAALVPASAARILDVGCSTGSLGAELKRRSGATVIGIEIDTEMATVARERLDRVIVGDVDEVLPGEQLAEEPFDCIIFGDVLEHLKNPWAALQGAFRHLADDGIIIASIPNVRHYSTFLALLRGYWPYRRRGIHDKTHLRFFTLHNIEEMFHEAGFRIQRLKRKYRIVERSHWVNLFSPFWAFLLWPFKGFLTFQYLIVATRIPGAAYPDPDIVGSGQKL